MRQNRFQHLSHSGNWPHGLGNWPHGLGNWPHGLSNLPNGLGKWPHGLGNWPHRPGARRQNAHIVSRKMLHFTYRNFVGQMTHRQNATNFCIILPMCQFAYFVGKMTHRPDTRRQIEPPRWSCYLI
jgi:hypothetical protein